MRPTKRSVKLSLKAQRHRVVAPEYDPIRQDFDLGLAQEMQREAQVLLTPQQPLKTSPGTQQRSDDPTLQPP